MSQNRLKELLSLLLDDDITAEQLDELTLIVSDDPEMLAQLRQHLLMSDRLSQYEDELRSDHRFMDAVQARIHAAEDTSGFVARVVASAKQEASGQSKLASSTSERFWLSPRAMAGWLTAAIALIVLVGVFFLTQHPTRRE